MNETLDGLNIFKKAISQNIPNYLFTDIVNTTQTYTAIYSIVCALA